MEQEQRRSCFEMLEPRRAQGVHTLLTRLLGRCTCESPQTRVRELYGVDGAREMERQPA